MISCVRSPRSPAPCTSRRASDRSELDPDMDRSPCGASPVVPRSPRLVSSQDSELPIPSIVLCDPPPGKNRSVTTDGTVGEDTNKLKDSGGIHLDVDLESSLRLSGVVLTGKIQ